MPDTGADIAYNYFVARALTRERFCKLTFLMLFCTCRDFVIMICFGLKDVIQPQFLSFLQAIMVKTSGVGKDYLRFM